MKNNFFLGENICEALERGVITVGVFPIRNGRVVGGLQEFRGELFPNVVFAKIIFLLIF
jgi:hypothetical protein